LSKWLDRLKLSGELRVKFDDEIEKIKEEERKEDERIRAMHNSEKKLRKLVTTESYVPPDVKKMR